LFRNLLAIHTCTQKQVDDDDKASECLEGEMMDTEADRAEEKTLRKSRVLKELRSWTRRMKKLTMRVRMMSLKKNINILIQ